MLLALRDISLDEGVESTQYYHHRRQNSVQKMYSLETLSEVSKTRVSNLLQYWAEM